MTSEYPAGEIHTQPDDLFRSDSTVYISLCRSLVNFLFGLRYERCSDWIRKIDDTIIAVRKDLIQLLYDYVNIIHPDIQRANET